MKPKGSSEERDSESAPRKHVNIRVRGLVQGVFFRSSTRKKAKELGLTGFARNEDDGSVYIEAEGDAERLSDLIAWLHHGSGEAEVSNVDVSDGDVQGFEDFETDRDA